MSVFDEYQNEVANYKEMVIKEMLDKQLLKPKDVIQDANNKSGYDLQIMSSHENGYEDWTVKLVKLVDVQKIRFEQKVVLLPPTPQVELNDLQPSDSDTKLRQDKAQS